MEYKKLNLPFEKLQLRSNLEIAIPEDAIGIKYSPENVQFQSPQSDTEIEELEFVFSEDELEEDN